MPAAFRTHGNIRGNLTTTRPTERRLMLRPVSGLVPRPNFASGKDYGFANTDCSADRK